MATQICLKELLNTAWSTFLLSPFPTTAWLLPLGCIVMTKETLVHEAPVFEEAVSASLEVLLIVSLPTQPRIWSWRQQLPLNNLCKCKQWYLKRIHTLEVFQYFSVTCHSDSLKSFIEKKQYKQQNQSKSAILVHRNKCHILEASTGTSSTHKNWDLEAFCCKSRTYVSGYIYTI